MSDASDVEERSQTFSANCFYSAKAEKRSAYITPLERKTQKQLPKRPLDMDKKLTRPTEKPVYLSDNCRNNSGPSQGTRNLRKASNWSQTKRTSVSNRGRTTESQSTLMGAISNKTKIKSFRQKSANKKQRKSPIKGLRKSVQLNLSGTKKVPATDRATLRRFCGKKLETTEEKNTILDNIRQASSPAPKKQCVTSKNESPDQLLNKIEQTQQTPQGTFANQESCDQLAHGDELHADGHVELMDVEPETADTLAHGVKVSPKKSAVMTSSFLTASFSPSSRKKTSTPNVLAASSLHQRRLHIMNKMADADDGLEQMTMDLGQKHFGATSCETCGMVYTASHPEDETSHNKFHRKYISSVKFPGWKKERLLQEFDNGRVLMVLHDDPKYHIKKVEEIRQLVDQELGFLEGDNACKTSSKVFLYITLDKKVSGCLIAEEISKGYRVIADEVSRQGLKEELAEFEKQRAWCCENEPIPAVCGVSRIWVSSQKRRQQIATKLLDCMRNFFIFGSILAKEAIAFSDPTPDGKMLATSYMKTERFLVYKYH